MQYHECSIEESLSRCGTDRSGLTEVTAANRLREQGENRIQGKKKHSLLWRFFAQFADFMILILLAGAAVSFLTSYLHHDSDYIDSIIILAIVVINALTGIVQESRAEKAIEALQKLASPQAMVLRDGKEQRIPAAKLVVGDLVRLSMGDLVPADLRLLESNGLRIEESSLTGESLPVEKDPTKIYPEDTPLADRKNMAFLGSSVSEGSGLGVVVATGMQTQMGRIAHMIHTEDSPETPLQQRLAKTGKVLGLCALGICFLIFLLDFRYKTARWNNNCAVIFRFVISLYFIKQQHKKNTDTNNINCLFHPHTTKTIPLIPLYDSSVKRLNVYPY